MTLDRAQWDYDDPLRAVLGLMRQCAGVVVLAFPRYAYHAVIEFPDSTSQRQLGDWLTPTMWNQIEFALAYTLGLPLVAVMDERMNGEPLLTATYAAYHVATVDMNASVDALPEQAVDALARFAQQVRAKSRADG